VDFLWVLIQYVYVKRPTKCQHPSGERRALLRLLTGRAAMSPQLAAVSCLPRLTSNWHGRGSLVFPQCGFVRASRHACVITCSPGELPLCPADVKRSRSTCDKIWCLFVQRYIWVFLRWRVMIKTNIHVLRRIVQISLVTGNFGDNNKLMSRACVRWLLFKAGEICSNSRWSLHKHCWWQIWIASCMTYGYGCCLESG